MQPILGKPIAEQLLQTAAERIRSQSVTPGLAAVLVGGDPASQIYVGLKAKAAQSVGVYFEKQVLPVTATTTEVQTVVRSLNGRPDIHGIIVQLPLPESIDADRVIATIQPTKDADGFHPETVARFLTGTSSVPPVFPRAILALLQNTGVPLEGKRACVFANSPLFARVMAIALGRLGVQADDNLSHTPTEMAAKLGLADIIITATGNPHSITGSMVRPGAIIIDGGITRTGEQVMGDTDPESFVRLEGYLTPVPGGVGPVTVALLIARVTELALGDSHEESIL
ncbi:MAG: bifunctional 5,10-methylenetetrahydrofolate dehydrogenase/5,10-methenyltetrahydrofolate cyclohydrolase [Candidatus Moraniibacteriota bacterium]